MSSIPSLNQLTTYRSAHSRTFSKTWEPLAYAASFISVQSGYQLGVESQIMFSTILPLLTDTVLY